MDFQIQETIPNIYQVVSCQNDSRTSKISSYLGSRSGMSELSMRRLDRGSGQESRYIVLDGIFLLEKLS